MVEPGAQPVVEPGARPVEPGARSVEPGARSDEPNGKPGVAGPGEPAVVEPSGEPAATHQHADPSSTDALLLAGNAVLVVVVLGLVLRPPRVRARADGRWRLREADRRPPPEGDR